MRNLHQVLKGMWNNRRPAIGRAALFLAVAMPVLLMASGAYADPPTPPDTFKSYASATGNKTSVLVDIFAYVSFLIGCVLSALGVSELRKHVENPSSVPLKNPLTKFGIGGILLALPFITGVAQETMGAFSMFKILKMNAYKFGTGAAGTDTIGALIRNGINNTMILVSVASLAAFIIGVFYTMRGIQMLRAHIENPGNAPLAESLKRLAVGGALFSFPAIVNVVYETFGAKGSALANTGFATTTAPAGGLDGMMVNFIKDISNAAYAGIEFFCYMAGILMVLFAMQRLVRTAQDGPRGPLGFGTIMMFIVAGLLLSFPQVLTAVDNSLLGKGQAITNVSFMSLGGKVDPAQIQNAKSVFSAVLAFMAIIGFLSIVRGLFLLKSFADGNNQATMMSVVTHIVAGSLAVNLGSFINAVQKSLGLTTLPVQFN